MATAQNWNYKVVSLTPAADIWGRIKEDKAQQLLDELGRQGWELTGILQPYGQHAPTAYLKRPA
ncbi:MAG: DUF4177 domain-containing protein [Proteobacteria bacterium]|nr:DUF4177 domain-containing protein [Pseudomonadota bacterium]